MLTALLTVDGDQLPVIPLVEVVGKTGAASPEHIGAIGAKFGRIPDVIATVAVAVTAGQLPGCGIV